MRSGNSRESLISIMYSKSYLDTSHLTGSNSDRLLYRVTQEAMSQNTHCRSQWRGIRLEDYGLDASEGTDTRRKID